MREEQQIAHQCVAWATEANAWAKQLSMARTFRQVRRRAPAARLLARLLTRRCCLHAGLHAQRAGSGADHRGRGSGQGVVAARVSYPRRRLLCLLAQPACCVPSLTPSHSASEKKSRRCWSGKSTVPARPCTAQARALTADCCSLPPLTHPPARPRRLRAADASMPKQPRAEVQEELRSLLRDTTALTERLQAQLAELAQRGWNVQ